MSRREWKRMRQYWRDCRKMLRMEWDLLDDSLRERWTAALEAMAGALHGRDAAQIRTRQQVLEDVVVQSVPPRRRSAIREYADIILVALTVAMGIRTFFIQPFKIPTGSMQPTLWGMFPGPYTEPFDGGPPEFPLLRPASFLLLGKSLADGSRVTGDHVFVDKLSYNFRRPRRGEIIVFDTKGIDIRDAHGNASDPKFYIKRLAGLPAERVRIAERRLWIDGEPLEDPVFRRIYTLGGYTNPDVGPFISPDFEWTIPADQYFTLGDNTTVSQDSRYWGGVPRDNLIGRGFWVYWPFFRETWQTRLAKPGDPSPRTKSEREAGYILWFGPPRIRVPAD